MTFEEAIRESIRKFFDKDEEIELKTETAFSRSFFDDLDREMNPGDYEETGEVLKKNGK